MYALHACDILPADNEYAVDPVGVETINLVYISITCMNIFAYNNNIIPISYPSAYNVIIIIQTS